MNELARAVELANRVLDRPGADPDDDIAILSRQLLRAAAHPAVAEALDRLDATAQTKRDNAKRTAISSEDWQWSNGFTAAVKEIRRELAFAAATLTPEAVPADEALRQRVWVDGPPTEAMVRERDLHVARLEPASGRWVTDGVVSAVALAEAAFESGWDSAALASPAAAPATDYVTASVSYLRCATCGKRLGDYGDCDSCAWDENERQEREQDDDDD